MVTPRRREGWSASAFRKWLGQVKFNHSKAARELGVSRTSVIKWAEQGAPKLVRLACQYLLGESK